MKVFYGILGAVGVAGALLALLMAWFTMTPTRDEFYERNIRIAKALDESRVKGLEADRDLKLKELDTARMLEIERDVLRDAIVNEFNDQIGSRTRAQDEARLENREDRQRRLTVAGLGLLLALLTIAFSIRGLRAEKRAGPMQSPR